MQPIRGDIHVAVERDVPAEEATLRDIIEWYKKVIRLADQWGVPTTMEYKYITQAWAEYVKEVAGLQKIPAGALGAFLQEMARSETRALALAEEANGQ